MHCEYTRASPSKESWNPPFNVWFVRTRIGSSLAEGAVIVIHVYVVLELNRFKDDMSSLIWTSKIR